MVSVFESHKHDRDLKEALKEIAELPSESLLGDGKSAAGSRE
jgi:hypothetical protein